MQSGGRDRNKETPIDGYEYDWISLKARRILCYLTKPGRGKAIKQAMSRRARRKAKLSIWKD